MGNTESVLGNRPENRPSIEAVLERLEQLSRTWNPPSPQVDEDAEKHDDNDWDLVLTVPLIFTSEWTPSDLKPQALTNSLEDPPKEVTATEALLIIPPSCSVPRS